jgi:hypothetical protein
MLFEGNNLIIVLLSGTFYVLYIMSSGISHFYSINWEDYALKKSSEKHSKYRLKIVTGVSGGGTTARTGLAMTSAPQIRNQISVILNVTRNAI